jgi:hypothetical protein
MLPTRRRLSLALLTLAGVAGTLGAAEARSRAAVKGRLLAATLSGSAISYPARRLWLVPDTPELRRALRESCAGWMAAMATGARHRDHLLRRRMATLDSALAPIATGDTAAESARFELMRRSEAVGDSLVTLTVHARGAALRHAPDAVAARFAATSVLTDAEGSYRFDAVPRGDWFVVPASLDPVGAPARWYTLHVRGREVTQDVGGRDGTPSCEAGR